MSWVSVECYVTNTTTNMMSHQQYQLKVKVNEEIISKIRELLKHEEEEEEEPKNNKKRNRDNYYDIDITSIKLVSSCYGCRTDPPQPGQQAHMDPGGCLYQNSLE
jgi:hypothetical protein